MVIGDSAHMRGNLSRRQDVGAPAFNGASVRALRRLGSTLAAVALLVLAPAPVSVYG
jgi:hypothetical protein